MGFAVKTKCRHSDNITLKEIFSQAIRLAEEGGVSILIETVGPLVSTEKALDIINIFGTASLKVCWNIRETFFEGKESADKTIQTLGAYIGFVRIGDKKDGKNVNPQNYLNGFGK